MVVHRSQGAGNLELSSQWCTLLKGITSWIALLLLLLASLSFIPVILSNDLSSVLCITHAPQKERFSHRNQYIYDFNIHETNKNHIRPIIYYNDDHWLRYHLAASISKSNKPSHGRLHIIPPRCIKKAKKASKEPAYKYPITQKSLLTSIIGGFWKLKWQNLSTTPGDCIRRQRFGGRCLDSLQRGDFVRGVYFPPQKRPIIQKFLRTSIIGGFRNSKWQNLSKAPGDCIRRQRFGGRRLNSLQRGDFVRGVYIPKNKSPITQKSILTSIIGGFWNLKWQNLSTAPGDCIRRQRLGGLCLDSLQRGDFVRGVFIPKNMSPITQKSILISIIGGFWNSKRQNLSALPGDFILRQQFVGQLLTTRTKEGDSGGGTNGSSSSSSSIGVGRIIPLIPHSTFDTATRTKEGDSVFDVVNGEAHGYGPVQVDSEGSIRWRRRKRYLCQRGRRRCVMMTR